MVTSFEDLPPDTDIIAAADDAPLKSCEEPGCTIPVLKPARGRTPKYCEVHRANGTRQQPTGKRTSWPRATEIEQTLVMYFNGLGGIVSIVDEYDGKCVKRGSENVAHELVEVGKVDKQFRKYLELIGSPGKYGKLSMAVFAMIFPIMVHHDLIPVMKFQPVSVPTPEREVA